MCSTARDKECYARNSARTGRERVPAVAVHDAAAKRMQRPAYEEGFDRLYRVDSAGAGATQPLCADDFHVVELPPEEPPAARRDIFLLSPRVDIPGSARRRLFKQRRDLRAGATNSLGGGRAARRRVQLPQLALLPRQCST
jgi:hypothetical protein